MFINPQIETVFRMLIRVNKPVHYDNLGITIDRLTAISALVHHGYARWTDSMTYLEWTGKIA
jgi:hypothetical protein